MVKLEHLHERLFVLAFVQFFDVKSLCSLSATCRHFRALLRSENVWRILHRRDHPFLAPGEHVTVIREQLEAVRAVVSAQNPSFEEMRDVGLGLHALAALLYESTPDATVYTGRQWLREDVTCWGFRKAFLRSAEHVLRQVPQLTHDNSVETQPDCFLASLSALARNYIRPMHKPAKRKPKPKPKAKQPKANVVRVAPAPTDGTEQKDQKEVRIAIQPSLRAVAVAEPKTTAVAVAEEKKADVQWAWARGDVQPPVIAVQFACADADASKSKEQREHKETKITKATKETKETKETDTKERGDEQELNTIDMKETRVVVVEAKRHSKSNERPEHNEVKIEVREQQLQSDAPTAATATATTLAQKLKVPSEAEQRTERNQRREEFLRKYAQEEAKMESLRWTAAILNDLVLNLPSVQVFLPPIAVAPARPAAAAPAAAALPAHTAVATVNTATATATATTATATPAATASKTDSAHLLAWVDGPEAKSLDDQPEPVQRFDPLRYYRTMPNAFDEELEWPSFFPVYRRKSKKQYIVRSRRRAGRSTLTQPCLTHIPRWPFLFDQFAYVWLLLGSVFLWIVCAFWIGWLLDYDQNPIPAVVYSFVIAMGPPFLYFFGKFISRYRFRNWHARKYGHDPNRLLPVAQRWLYAYYRFNERPVPHRRLRCCERWGIGLGCLVIAFVTLTVAAVTMEDTNHHWLIASRFCTTTIYSLAFFALFLMCLGGAIGTLFERPFAVGHVLFSLACWVGCVVVLTLWLAIYDVVHLYVPVALADTTMITILCIGFLPIHDASDSMRFFRHRITRLECLPIVVFLTLVWANLQPHSKYDATWPLNWTLCFEPLVFSGIVHLFLALRLEIYDTNITHEMLMQTRLFGIETAWSKAELSDRQRAEIDNLRRNRLLEVAIKMLVVYTEWLPHTGFMREEAERKKREKKAAKVNLSLQSKL